MIKIRRGLDLPITGAPEQTIYDGPAIRSVAVIGPDYHGMKPTMAVAVGDKVTLGQLLFTDKKTEGVRYTAPASGTVAAINRGARRVLQSVVIDVEEGAAETFDSYSSDQISALTAEQVQQNLNQSGLWAALRTRPYSKVPALGSQPSSVFVTAMDTNPLTADAELVIGEHRDDFVSGLAVLSRLTSGAVHVCKAEGTDIGTSSESRVETHEFSGPHPSGNAGTHIHFLDPVSATKTVWTVGYQDVIAIGKLFTTGQLYTGRVIALAGPQVEQPRLLRTRIGANTDELTAGQLKSGENRIISGSVFGGRTAAGAYAYLGRYANQISVLAEGREREFMHYLRPGLNKFSKLALYITALTRGKKFAFDTSSNGSERAMVPVGAYEEIMPLDILPTQLLRAVIVSDTDMAQKLGCLELDEEDLALCSFVCPGKYEYGPILRDNLTLIEKEG